MDKITKLPWKLKHVRGDNFAVQEFEIRGMFGESPATYPIFNKNTSAIDGTTVFCSPADAEYICLAVNSHEGLVEAVRIALLVIEDMHHRAGFHGNEQGRYIEIKEALKAADGEGVK